MQSLNFNPTEQILLRVEYAYNHFDLKANTAGSIDDGTQTLNYSIGFKAPAVLHTVRAVVGYKFNL